MASSHANIQFSILKIEGKFGHAQFSGIIHVGKPLLYFAWPVPVTLLRVYGYSVVQICKVCHEKTDLRVFVIVIPKEVWVCVAAPILLLV